jgi:hydrogenase maturation protein HypF
MEIRKAIGVAGIVQGVGFRPYVYRLAAWRQLRGFVTNTAAGVSIEVQGPAADVEDFVRRLPVEAPALARVTGVTVTELPCTPEADFRIVASRHGDAVQTLIPPDVATCPACLRELLDPADRRYRYPFINCTDCGPRFTITRCLPYDRPYTSMAPFEMCPACQNEYDDPADRRFHAQPNGCWECGPRLQLWERDEVRLSVADPVAAAAEALRCGKIVAVKGVGGFHLAVDATNAEAVDRLRERKQRVDKPFAVMIADLAAARAFCEVDEPAAALLQQPQRPIVLLPRRPGTAIADAVAPFQRTLGLFLPYTPLHHLLLKDSRLPALVMTSGNRSEEPIAIDNREARARLRTLADLFLVHDREILLRCDDSVVRPAAGRARVIRRARGHVPVPIFLHRTVPAILAVGGEMKNTICLTPGKHAFLSQHVGELENAEAQRFFEEAVAHLQHIAQITPVVVAHDMHPDYFTTRWAERRHGVRRVAVQHHHAHLASCMAENHLAGETIGIILDGTGSGTDGRIWGGEVLVGGYAGFRRAAHLKYVAMPGGETAVREPWRMAVAHLAAAMEIEQLEPVLLRLAPEPSWRTLLRMIERRLNSPLTSSCGRLFDAVAALLGVRSRVNYEAQAAIELEARMGAGNDARGSYPFAITEEAGVRIINPSPMFQELLRDLARGESKSVMSRRFHRGLVDAFSAVACALAGETGLDRVCLSGGSFQNVFLLEQLTAALEHAGLRVYSQAEVPTGDGGISLGQAMVAAHVDL